MNNNRRMLWIILGGVAAMIVMMVMIRSVIPSWKQGSGRIIALEDEIEAKEREVSLIAAEKTRRETAKIQPLAGSVDRAAAEYARYLKPLLHDSGLTVDEFQGPPPPEAKSLAAGQKKPSIYQTLPYQIRAKGDLPSLTSALESMRRTPVLHRVKSLTLDRLDPKDTIAKLGIQMTVEVLVNPAAKGGPKLMPYPDPRMVPMDTLAVLTGLPGGSLINPWTAEGLSVTQGFRYPHATSARVDLSKKNPFLGEVPPPPVVVVKPPEPEPEDPVVPEGPDLRQFVRLDTIVPPTEAFLRNTYIQQAPIRIKSAPMSGYEIFRIMDEERSRVVVRAKVLKIDARVVYFQVGEDIYGIRFGQSLADAMKRPLSQSEMDESGTYDLFDAAFAEPPETTKKKTPTRKKL